MLKALVKGHLENLEYESFVQSNSFSKLNLVDQSSLVKDYGTMTISRFEDECSRIIKNKLSSFAANVQDGEINNLKTYMSVNSRVFKNYEYAELMHTDRSDLFELWQTPQVQSELKESRDSHPNSLTHSITFNRRAVALLFCYRDRHGNYRDRDNKGLMRLIAYFKNNKSQYADIYKDYVVTNSLVNLIEIVDSGESMDDVFDQMPNPAFEKTKRRVASIKKVILEFEKYRSVQDMIKELHQILYPLGDERDPVKYKKNEKVAKFFNKYFKDERPEGWEGLTHHERNSIKSFYYMKEGLTKREIRLLRSNYGDTKEFKSMLESAKVSKRKEEINEDLVIPRVKKFLDKDQALVKLVASLGLQYRDLARNVRKQVRSTFNSVMYSTATGKNSNYDERKYQAVEQVTKVLKTHRIDV